MLSKGAISVAKNLKVQYLSSLFLVDKKHGGIGPVINQKQLNKMVPYAHFKIWKACFCFFARLI